jgi:hypothetical protein
MSTKNYSKDSDFMILTLTIFYYCHQMKGNEMGGACGTYGERRRAYRIWWGDLMERDNLEDLGLEGRMY